MSGLLEGLRTIVDPTRIRDAPIELTEEGKGNKCAPIPVAYLGNVWALRLTDDDCHRVLYGSKQDESKSFRKLPDYLIFAEPHGKRRKSERGSALNALVCELKSSDTGAARAMRQVQLGKFLVEYLVRVASFATGSVKVLHDIDIRGLIASPSYPPQIRTKGATRADQPDDGWELDAASDMWIYRIGCDDDIRLEELFR